MMTISLPAETVRFTSYSPSCFLIFKELNYYLPIPKSLLSATFFLFRFAGCKDTNPDVSGQIFFRIFLLKINVASLRTDPFAFAKGVQM
jgi:hypothetical protein